MTENTESVCRRIAVNGKPSWPYEEWKYDECNDAEKDRECEFDIQSNNSAKKQHVDGSDKTSPDEDYENDFEPIHWWDDLDAPVDKTVPLYRLLSQFEPELNCTTLKESKVIFNVLLEMMSKTAQELSAKYKVFEECYVLPVGSFMENIKIGKPDEFDFAVILPYFKNFDKLNSLYNKEHKVLLNDPDFISMANDIATNCSAQTLLQNFQAALKHLWTLYMLDYIPEGWNLPEDALHEDTSYIAPEIGETYHMSRQTDEFALDMDVCFWTPVSKSTLEQMKTELKQADYLMNHCLNEDNTIYAVLGRDGNIDMSLNLMRFAMSLEEREKLNENGENSNRLKCYKLVKCIAKYFIPRLQKRYSCKRCHNSLVSSFCLKNIVLYMIENYPSNDMWTDDYLPNRVLEVFSILNQCVKVNCGIVSGYFTPYMIMLGSYFYKYNPGKQSLVETGNKRIDSEPLETPCFLPDGIEQFETLFCHDHYSKAITQNYFKFLHQSEWSLPEVIDRLHEMLIALREADTDERKYYAENPGCLCFNIFLH